MIQFEKSHCPGAAEDGSLEKALAKPQEDEVEALRKQAADSLLRPDLSSVVVAC